MLRRVAVLVIALALVGGAVWLCSMRVAPATIPQDQLHKIGTTSKIAAMEPLPAQHDVVIAGVGPGDLARLARSYLPRWLGGAPAAEVQGYYDPDSGEIHITGEVTRFEAMAPLPWLQARFRRALRHEYGHAMLYDWLFENGDAASVVLVPAITQRDASGTDAIPPELRPAVREYRKVSTDVYGSPYFTTDFTEYFAESYARFLEGEEVPRATRQFLDERSRNAVP